MTPVQEAKLDKLLTDVNYIKVDVAVVKEKVETTAREVEKHRSDIEKLKVWKYINFGTLATAITSLFK